MFKLVIYILTIILVFCHFSALESALSLNNSHFFWQSTFYYCCHDFDLTLIWPNQFYLSWKKSETFSSFLKSCQNNRPVKCNRISFIYVHYWMSKFAWLFAGFYSFFKLLLFSNSKHKAYWDHSCWQWSNIGRKSYIWWVTIMYSWWVW